MAADMSAMHHDSSADLNVVGSKLKNILEVYKVWIKIFQQPFFCLYTHLYKAYSLDSDISVL